MRNALFFLVSLLTISFSLWLLIQVPLFLEDAPGIWTSVSTWVFRGMKGLYILSVIITVVLVVWENGRPARTLAWILVSVFVPVGGVIAYTLFGGNGRKEKLFSLKGAKDLQRINAWLEEFLVEWKQVETPDSFQEKSGLVSLLMSNSKALITEDNRAEVLQDGKATFQSIFSAILRARHHIHLQFYVIEDGELLNELIDLLIDKRQEGVEVRVMFDSVGSWSLSNHSITRLRDQGVECYSFMPVRFPRLGNRINFRNHRKIVVIDGETGFVGGLNLADRYIDGIPGIGSWRDTHLKLIGDAVKGLQLVFLTDWFFASGEDCARREMFPPTDNQGHLPVQIVASGPDSRHPGIMQAYFSSINLAKEYIYITNAYLIPDESILTALKTAALSGVDVRIIVPEKADSRVAQLSTRSYLGELLEAGVRIYLYQAGFVHAKVFVSDDMLCSVGTANWDQRSFDQNFEVNAFLYNQDIALQLKEAFIQDTRDSLELELKSFQNRPRWKRMLYSLARLLSPFL